MQTRPWPTELVASAPIRVHRPAHGGLVSRAPFLRPRHGIPRGTASRAARHPARHGIPRGTASRARVERRALAHCPRGDEQMAEERMGLGCALHARWIDHGVASDAALVRPRRRRSRRAPARTTRARGSCSSKPSTSSSKRTGCRSALGPRPAGQPVRAIDRLGPDAEQRIDRSRRAVHHARAAPCEMPGGIQAELSSARQSREQLSAQLAHEQQENAAELGEASCALRCAARSQAKPARRRCTARRRRTAARSPCMCAAATTSPSLSTGSPSTPPGTPRLTSLPLWLEHHSIRRSCGLDWRPPAHGGAPHV
jgi:hypothetical protein